MTDSRADLRKAIDGGWLGDNLTQPLSQDEVDALIVRSVNDPGAPLEAEMVARLAITKTLNAADFARIIARLKANTDVSITFLQDQIKKLASAERETSGQGQPISFTDIAPWDDPVDGAALLDEIVSEIRRYVMLPEASAIAVALWVIHTYCYDDFEHSPRLVITSPEKQCGKTTLLDVLEALVARPLGTSNITVAAMFRTVEKYRPTLLIDEADSFLKDNEDMRGVVNSGHKRNGGIIRTVGDEFEPRSFSTFCPTAIAAIGSLPGTIEDRAVIVTMRRQLPDEARERFRSHKATHLKDLARKAVRWAADNETAMSEADPLMPKGMHNRAADNWTALLAIADCAGGDWPAKARDAGLELSQLSAESASQSGGILLLRDIQTIFEARAASNHSDADRISSTDLIAGLVGLDDRPWGTWNRGKAITSSKVANMLAQYHVRPNTIRLTNKSQPNGYKRAQFEDVFKRYLPEPPINAAQASPTSPTQGNPPVSGLSDTSPQARGGEGVKEAESGGNAGFGEGGELDPSAPEHKQVAQREISNWANAWLLQDGNPAPGDVGPIPDHILAMATRLPPQKPLV